MMRDNQLSTPPVSGHNVVPDWCISWNSVYQICLPLIWNPFGSLCFRSERGAQISLRVTLKSFKCKLDFYKEQICASVLFSQRNGTKTAALPSISKLPHVAAHFYFLFFHLIAKHEANFGFGKSCSPQLKVFLLSTGSSLGASCRLRGGEAGWTENQCGEELHYRFHW